MPNETKDRHIKTLFMAYLEGVKILFKFDVYSDQICIDTCINRENILLWFGDHGPNF